MPNAIIKCDETAKITSVVIKFIAIREIAKDLEYITPLNVFVYIKKIKRPMHKEMASATKTSSTEYVATLSKNLKSNNRSKFDNCSILNTFFIHYQVRCKAPDFSREEQVK